MSQSILPATQADRAFKKYFGSPKKTSVEVLVCHGNIIRYLICRPSLAIMTILPGCSSDPHTHKVAEESFLVISGSGIIDVDGAQTNAQKGDCIFVEPNECHTVINTGDIPLECVLATGPAWQPEDSY